MHTHLSQGNVLSWNDNLNSTQAQYLSCPPYLEMKGQNEVKALHACNLLDQCFSFCDLWTGKPWDKCIIPFSSQLAYHEQDPCTDRHKLVTSLMVTTEQRLANKAKTATTVFILRELIQLNHKTANMTCSQFWRSQICYSHVWSVLLTWQHLSALFSSALKHLKAG